MFLLIILLLKYNITNIRCDCGQYTRTFPLGTLNCMDVLYYHPPLASGKITHPCNSRYHGKIFLYIIYSYKYLESDLIKHCHVIFIDSLGQPLITRSHSKVQRSRGNPKEIPTWASRVSNYSYFPWFSWQQTCRLSQSRRYSITWYLMQKYSI